MSIWLKQLSVDTVQLLRLSGGLGDSSRELIIKKKIQYCDSSVMDILLQALFSTCSAKSVFSAISKTIQVPFGALDLFQPASQPASRHRSSGLVFLYSSASPVDTFIYLLICRNGQEWKTNKVINYERSQSESEGQTGLNPPCSGLCSRWRSCCWISQIQDKQRQEIEARLPEYKKIFF